LATQIGIGYSQEVKTIDAAQEAASSAKLTLNTESVDFVLILSTIHHDAQKLAQTVRKIFGDVRTIGCSTAGIILSEKIITHGIAILAITSDEMKFGIGFAHDITSKNIQQAGSEMARNIISDFGQHGRQVCLFFVDGQISDSSLLLKGVQEVLGTVFPLVGAGSCDDFHYGKTFQIYQDEALEYAVSGLIMGGQMTVGVSGRHGWKPLGKPRTITKVEENIIKTIDGKKAASLYEEYFGVEYQKLRSTLLGQMSILYPLGIFVEGSDEYLLRNAVDILEDGSIVCQGGVPEETEVHIMIGNKDSLD